jgi:hypothetical protein
MKKFLRIFICALAVLSLAGCNKKDNIDGGKFYWETVPTTDFSLREGTEYENYIYTNGRMFALASDDEGNPVISVGRMLDSGENSGGERHEDESYYSWTYTAESRVEEGNVSAVLNYVGTPNLDVAACLSDFMKETAEPTGSEKESKNYAVSDLLYENTDGKNVSYVILSTEEGGNFTQIIKAYYPVKMPDGSNAYIAMELTETRNDETLLSGPGVIDYMASKLLFAEGVL